MTKSVHKPKAASTSASISAPRRSRAKTTPAVSTPAVTQAAPTPKGKLGLLVELLRRDGGATVAEMTAATGWQPHSVRGALSGAIKKGLGLTVASDIVDGRRTYRLAEAAG